MTFFLMVKFFGFFILLGLFSGFCGKAPVKITEKQPTITTGDSIARYGEKIRFAPNAPVYFENFGLTYLGERRVIADMPRQSNGSFPSREFVYFDFKVQRESEEQTISWSSGTGDIAPTRFTVGGRQYELELKISDKLGKLAENELVIWKK